MTKVPTDDELDDEAQWLAFKLTLMTLRESRLNDPGYSNVLFLDETYRIASRFGLNPYMLRNWIDQGLWGLGNGNT